MSYHVISIGIANYGSSDINNLNYSDEDAGEMMEILRHSLGSDLTYNPLLRNSEATQIGIRTALSEDKLKSANKEDTLIIFYSGHGALGVNAEGKHEAFLAPYDATRDIGVSGISTSELQTTLDNLKHGNKIVLLDCCYSGGANAKTITHLKHKDIGSIKAFQNQDYAKGTFVFTACKADETAIEVTDLKHGLFTYHLIEELVRDRKSTTVALSGIHDPIDKAVKVSASKYNHTQTPTLKQSTEGSMSLPKLSAPKSFKPEIIKVPTIKDEAPPNIHTPRVSITDKDTRELLQSTIELVENASKTKFSQIAFRSMIGKIFSSVKQEHKDLPKNVNTADDLAQVVTRLESKSYQLFITSAAIALAGDDKTTKIFTEEASEILNWKRGHNGTVAAIESSDVVLLMIMYIIAICNIYTDDYSALKKLVDQSATDDYRNVQIKVAKYYEIHYADALGGNAKNVIMHAIEFICAQKWFLELLGIDEDKMKDLVIQANFLLVMLSSHEGEKTYAAYNDYENSTLNSFVDKIKTDNELQVQLAKLFEVRPSDIRMVLALTIRDVNDASGARWGHPPKASKTT